MTAVAQSDVSPAPVSASIPASVNHGQSLDNRAFVTPMYLSHSSGPKRSGDLQQLWDHFLKASCAPTLDPNSPEHLSIHRLELMMLLSARFVALVRHRVRQDRHRTSQSSMGVEQPERRERGRLECHR